MDLKFLSLIFPIIWAFLGILFSFTILTRKNRQSKHLARLFYANVTLILVLEFLIVHPYSLWTQLTIVVTSIMSFLIISSSLILIVPLLNTEKMTRNNTILFCIILFMIWNILIFQMLIGSEATLAGKFSFMAGFGGAMILLLGLFVSLYIKERLGPNATIKPVKLKTVEFQRDAPKLGKKGMVALASILVSGLILVNFIQSSSAVISVVCEVKGNNVAVGEMYVKSAPDKKLAMVGPSYTAGDKNLFVQIFQNGELTFNQTLVGIGNGSKVFGYKFKLVEGDIEFLAITQLYKDERLISEDSRNITITISKS